MTKLFLFGSVLISSALACGDSVPKSAPPEAAAPARLQIAVIPGIQALADSAGLDGLLSLLRTSEGDFARTTSGPLEFSGDERLFPAFSYFGDSAVRRLVQCLDDTTRVTAVREGAPVMMGIMCSRALYRIAFSTYHETDGEWPGIVLENATPEELRAAKLAWEPVVRARAYALP